MNDLTLLVRLTFHDLPSPQIRLPFPSQSQLTVLPSINPLALRLSY